MSSSNKIGDDRPIPGANSVQVQGIPPPLPHPEIPVAQPVPREWDAPEDENAALAMELHPDDQAIVNTWPAAKRRRFFTALDRATSSPSALVKGACIVLCESKEYMGRELKRYGGAMTDSFRKASDNLGEMRAFVKEDHGVFRKVSRGLWDAVEEVAPDHGQGKQQRRR